MDECKWAKARFDEIVAGLTPFLKATGYKDENIVWIPMSGMTGENLKEKIDPKICSWYKGPTFIEVINDIKLVERFP